MIRAPVESSREGSPDAGQPGAHGTEPFGGRRHSMSLHTAPSVSGGDRGGRRASPTFFSDEFTGTARVAEAAGAFEQQQQQQCRRGSGSDSVGVVRSRTSPSPFPFPVRGSTDVDEVAGSQYSQRAHSGSGDHAVPLTRSTTRPCSSSHAYAATRGSAASGSNADRRPVDEVARGESRPVKEVSPHASPYDSVPTPNSHHHTRRSPPGAVANEEGLAAAAAAAAAHAASRSPLATRAGSSAGKSSAAAITASGGGAASTARRQRDRRGRRESSASLSQSLSPSAILRASPPRHRPQRQRSSARRGSPHSRADTFLRHSIETSPSSRGVSSSPAAQLFAAQRSVGALAARTIARHSQSRAPRPPLHTQYRAPRPFDKRQQQQPPPPHAGAYSIPPALPHSGSSAHRRESGAGLCSSDDAPAVAPCRELFPSSFSTASRAAAHPSVPTHSPQPPHSPQTLRDFTLPEQTGSLRELEQRIQAIFLSATTSSSGLRPLVTSSATATTAAATISVSAFTTAVDDWSDDAEEAANDAPTPSVAFAASTRAERDRSSPASPPPQPAARTTPESTALQPPAANDRHGRGSETAGLVAHVPAMDSWALLQSFDPFSTRERAAADQAAALATPSRLTGGADAISPSASSSSSSSSTESAQQTAVLFRQVQDALSVVTRMAARVQQAKSTLCEHEARFGDNLRAQLRGEMTAAAAAAAIDLWGGENSSKGASRRRCRGPGGAGSSSSSSSSSSSRSSTGRSLGDVSSIGTGEEGQRGEIGARARVSSSELASTARSVLSMRRGGQEERETDATIVGGVGSSAAGGSPIRPLPTLLCVGADAVRDLVARARDAIIAASREKYLMLKDLQPAGSAHTAATDNDSHGNSNYGRRSASVGENGANTAPVTERGGGARRDRENEDFVVQRLLALPNSFTAARAGPPIMPSPPPDSQPLRSLCRHDLLTPESADAAAAATASPTGGTAESHAEAAETPDAIAAAIIQTQRKLPAYMVEQLQRRCSVPPENSNYTGSARSSCSREGPPRRSSSLPSGAPAGSGAHAARLARASTSLAISNRVDTTDPAKVFSFPVESEELAKALVLLYHTRAHHLAEERAERKATQLAELNAQYADAEAAALVRTEAARRQDALRSEKQQLTAALATLRSSNAATQQRAIVLGTALDEEEKELRRLEVVYAVTKGVHAKLSGCPLAEATTEPREQAPRDVLAGASPTAHAEVAASGSSKFTPCTLPARSSEDEAADWTLEAFDAALTRYMDVQQLSPQSSSPPVPAERVPPTPPAPSDVKHSALARPPPAAGTDRQRAPRAASVAEPRPRSAGTLGSRGGLPDTAYYQSLGQILREEQCRRGIHSPRAGVPPPPLRPWAVRNGGSRPASAPRVVAPAYSWPSTATTAVHAEPGHRSDVVAASTLAPRRPASSPSRSQQQQQQQQQQRRRPSCRSINTAVAVAAADEDWRRRTGRHVLATPPRPPPPLGRPVPTARSSSMATPWRSALVARYAAL